MSLLDFCLKIKTKIDFYLINPKNKKFDNIEDLEIYSFEENSSNKEILSMKGIINSEKHYMPFIKNISIGSLIIILTTWIDLN